MLYAASECIFTYRSGELNQTQFFEITKYLAEETEHIPWWSATRAFKFLDRILGTTADYGLLLVSTTRYNAYPGMTLKRSWKWYMHVLLGENANKYVHNLLYFGYVSAHFIHINRGCFTGIGAIACIWPSMTTTKHDYVHSLYRLTICNVISHWLRLSTRGQR